MKFSLVALSSVLFATTILAAPRGSTLAERQARRLSRTSKPLNVFETGTKTDDTGVSQVQYSSNWAGALYAAPPQGTFTAVSAQVTVPSTTGASGRSASAWVGIDGDTYGNAILQTGIDFTRTSSGTTYDAWYEWYPDYAYDFSMSMSAGDVIQMSVTSTSASAGTAVLQNLSTGQKVTKALNAPSSSSHLGGQNAEWIVEAYESGGQQVTLANFGTVHFTSTSAKTSSGSSVSASGAQVIEIKNGNTVETGVSISGSTVAVTYQG